MIISGKINSFFKLDSLKTEIAPGFFLLTGAIVLLSITALLLVSVIGFLFDISLSSYHLPLSIFSGGAVVWFLNLKGNRIIFSISFLSSIIIIAISIYLSSFFYDFSNDGLTYHQVAMAELHEGWNPVLTPQHDNFKVQKHNKGSYIIAGNIYKFTGNFVHGKALNFILFFGVLSFSIGVLFLFPFLSRFQVVLIAIGLCLNPVWSTEAALFFVDGQLYLALLSLVLALCYFFMFQTPMSSLVVVATIILSYSFKLTGLIYTTIFLLSYLAIVSLFSQRRMTRFLFAILGGALILAVLILNYNPFVTNIYLNEDKSPFGSGAEKSYKRYTGFSMTDRVKAVVKSALMKPANIPRASHGYHYSAANVLENTSMSSPFAFKFADIKKFAGLVARTGGYTQLFGVAMAIGFILIAMGFIENRGPAIAVCFVLISFLISIIIFPYSYWFRYVPHIWILPFLCACYAFSRSRRLFNWGGMVILVLMLIVATTYSWFTFKYNWDYSRKIDSTIMEIKKHTHPVRVYFSKNREVKRFFFNELGIEYLEVNSKNNCDVFITKRQAGGIVFRGQ